MLPDLRPDDHDRLFANRGSRDPELLEWLSERGDAKLGLLTGNYEAIARRRAGKPAVPYSRQRTVVIGDTPRDIACAQADGVRCIAVATGPYRVDQLSSADAVVRDAGELRATLSEWLSR